MAGGTSAAGYNDRDRQVITADAYDGLAEFGVEIDKINFQNKQLPIN